MPGCFEPDHRIKNNCDQRKQICKRTSNTRASISDPKKRNAMLHISGPSSGLGLICKTASVEFPLAFICNGVSGNCKRC
jgi:hypothetical protein